MPRLFLLSLLALSLPAVAAPKPTGDRNNIHGARYGEILVVTGGPFVFKGGVYNTLGLNDCPEKEWKALDPAKIKKEHKAVAVLLNGPRYFIMDAVLGASPGEVETFGDLQARHLADVRLTLGDILRGGSHPYEGSEVTRNTTFVYRKGTQVYELIDPQGNVYIMQTYALIVDPNLKESDLATLGSRLKLPKGWKYQVRTLDKDLNVRAWGKAFVIQDELKNSYQRIDAEPKPQAPK